MDGSMYPLRPYAERLIPVVLVSMLLVVASGAVGQDFQDFGDSGSSGLPNAASPAVTATSGTEVRIKDLTNVRGVRPNHLLGFGLVIGLAGSGDSKASLVTSRAAARMLTNLGMTTEAAEVTGGSVAAVMVTTDLPAFARSGDRIDVRLSTIGDARSLAGGTLVTTPLKAADQKVYAASYGPVVVGQADGVGPRVLTVATVPNGGIVEREFHPELGTDGQLTLSLKNPDFTVSSRIAAAINTAFRGFFATAEDLAAVSVRVPPMFEDQLVDFVARLEKITVKVDQKAMIVVNERTGTVVVGQNVRISPVAISHRNLHIAVAQEDQTLAAERVVPVQGSTVGDLTESMNALGVSPADLIGILQSIKAAGALQAELKFL